MNNTHISDDDLDERQIQTQRDLKEDEQRTRAMSKNSLQLKNFKKKPLETPDFSPLKRESSFKKLQNKLNLEFQRRRSKQTDEPLIN